MRLRFILFGTFVFLSPLQAHAVPAPPDLIYATAATTYAQALMNEAQQLISNLPTGNISCGTQFEKEIVHSMREMFLDVEKGFAEPQEDIVRSVCFAHDVMALERYIRDLLREAMAEAQNETCNQGAARQYVITAKYVWDGLLTLRKHGLDPLEVDSVTGAEFTTTPSAALPVDDDEYCPYTSPYASTGFADVGCQYANLPASASDRLKEEAQNNREILHTTLGDGITGLGILELPELRNQIKHIRNAVDSFVSGVTRNRGVFPSSGVVTPSFTFTTVPNAGETGCRDWPSDVTAGSVTGKDIPLQQYFPYVLTNEMAELWTLLEMRQDKRWDEYILVYEEEVLQRPYLGLPLYAPTIGLQEISRDHRDRESSNIFSIREPQQRYEKLANALHAKTRLFAYQVVSPPGFIGIPPLRVFTRDYATFLSRMCQNRGCMNNLIRAVELSVRDACFPSFLQDQFFYTNPSASTLGACQALYTAP